jgi:hypothetical protein
MILSRAPHPLFATASLRALVLAGLFVLLVGATAIAANRPPTATDVAHDGTLAVVVVDWLHARPEPVAGADVEVAAVRDGTVVGTASAVTDASGVASLIGVPRATAGSPVELHVAARRSQEWVDAEGCARGESWTGEAAVVQSGVGASVELEVAHASSMVCLPTSARAVAGASSELAETNGPPPGALVLVGAVLAALVGVLRLRRRHA